MISISNGEPKKILLVQTGFLGDAVLASGLIRGLRSQSATMQIGIVVRAGFQSLYSEHPGLDQLHTIDKSSRRGYAKLVDELRETAYDLALIPHRSFHSAWFVRRAGIPRRIGFRQSAAPWLLSERVDYRITDHEADRNAALATAAGIHIAAAERRPWLVPSQNNIASIDTFLGSDPRPIVLIAPGSVWPTKRWGRENFGELARQLLARQLRVVVSGGGAERDICAEVARIGGVPAGDVVAGMFSPGELLALISRATRVVSNDSAPLHLAESVGRPSTAIFGPTVPEFGFAPRLLGSDVVEIFGLACRPCRIHGGDVCPIGTHDCMRLIEVSKVADTLVPIIG